MRSLNCYLCSLASVMPDCLQSHGLWSPKLLCPWDSPGKNPGVGCCFRLQNSYMHMQIKFCDSSQMKEGRWRRKNRECKKGKGRKERRKEKRYLQNQKRKFVCHVSCVIANFVTLDLLNRQDTQKGRNTTYVQPYMWKIRDISQAWAIKDIFLWGKISGVESRWLMAGGTINVTGLFF